MSGAVTGRIWTDEETETLRAAYAAGGIRAAMTALPDRSRYSLEMRAHRLGLRSSRRWTEDDDNRLRWMWGANSLDRIAHKLGRTPWGCYDRARKLGLEYGCSQGSEYLTNAADRAGVSTGKLRKILAASGTATPLAMSRPYRRNGRNSYAKWRHHTVDRCDVDEAVAAWTRGEIDA